MNDYKANSSKTCPDIDYHQELVGACLFCRWLPSDEQIKRLQGTGTQPYTQSDQEWANKPQLSTQQRGDNQPITPKSAKTGEPKEAKPADPREELVKRFFKEWDDVIKWNMTGEATALSPDYFQRELKDAKEIKKLVDKVAGKTGKHTQHCWDRSDTYCICPVSTRLEDTTALSDHQDSVTRFEVIDHRKDGGGRAFVAYDINAELMYQDDGRTLKVRITERGDSVSARSSDRYSATTQESQQPLTKSTAIDHILLRYRGRIGSEYDREALGLARDEINQLISHRIVEELEALLPQGVSFLNKRIIQRRIKELGELSE